MRFLVVDDEQICLKVMTALLKKHAEVIHIASSIEEAVELFDITPYYDVIFLDIMLGEESGIELLQHIRKRDTQVVIAMVTGHSEPINVLESYNNKCDYFLIKPVHQKTIDKVINKIKKAGNHNGTKNQEG